MAFDFSGKRAVVCGGSRGIGRSIALGLAAGRCRRLDLRPRRRDAGSRRAARSRSSATPRMPASAISPMARRSAATSPMRRRRWAASTSWSTTRRASVRRDDEAGWAVSIAVDMMAIVHATQAALPFLKEAKGSVVNTSSISALRHGGAAAALWRDQGGGDPLHRDAGGDVCEGRHPRERRRTWLDRVSRRRLGPAQERQSRTSTTRSCAPSRSAGWAIPRKWRTWCCSSPRRSRPGSPARPSWWTAASCYDFGGCAA